MFVIEDSDQLFSIQGAMMVEPRSAPGFVVRMSKRDVPTLSRGTYREKDTSYHSALHVPVSWPSARLPKHP